MTSKRSHQSERIPTFWWLGLAVGAIVSSAITIIVVVWELVENPGGIFRSATGTNWGFVFDTAISWFVPTFLHVAVIVSVLHLMWSAVSKSRRNRGADTS